MAGIPKEIYHRLRVVLIDCGAFESDRQLRSIFAHALLRPWRDQLPQVDTPAGRVDATISVLADQYRSDTRDNILVLLLRILSERIEPIDARHQRLADLAQDLQLAIADNLTQSFVSTDNPLITGHGFEITSLRRQLEQLRHNLLLLEEKRASFIDPRSVPVDLEEAEKLTRDQIKLLMQKLDKLGIAHLD